MTPVSIKSVTDSVRDPDRWSFRVRELTERTGLSKSKVLQALREGKLEGQKLGGTLLITAESVEAYLASATPWEPHGSNR